ncbi:hypothetical protein Taro_054720, partial [Colocasia esculenta]|nr:hypothetical protein [Colocasia esculenta]
LSFQRPTQTGNPNWIPSVRTRHFHPPGRVGTNGTPIRSLFEILDPRVVGFSLLCILGYFLDPSFQSRTQFGDPNWIPSVPTYHFNPPDRVGDNDTPIGSLFGILDPRVVGFSPLYILDYFLDPSIERPTQSGSPNWIPSIPTRHFHPPGRVGANGIPIRSLFGILDPQIRQLNAEPNPGVQIGFRQFPHVTLTHPVVSEKTARRSDPYLGFWTPG